MRPSSPRSEAGSAVIEVLVLAVLLIVPLVYLVLTVATVQGAAFAAEGASRQAARSIVLAQDDGAGRAAADDAVRVALADWRVADGAADVAITCAPDPGDCLTPRGSVRVAVGVSVALPLLPAAVAVGAPGTIRIDSVAVQRVSMFQPRDDEE